MSLTSLNMDMNTLTLKLWLSIQRSVCLDRPVYYYRLPLSMLLQLRSSYVFMAGLWEVTAGAYRSVMLAKALVEYSSRGASHSVVYFACLRGPSSLPFSSSGRVISPHVLVCLTKGVGGPFAEFVAGSSAYAVFPLDAVSYRRTASRVVHAPYAYGSGSRSKSRFHMTDGTLSCTVYKPSGRTLLGMVAPFFSLRMRVWLGSGMLVIVDLSSVDEYSIEQFSWVKKSAFSQSYALCTSRFAPSAMVVRNSLTFVRDVGGHIIRVDCTAENNKLYARVHEVAPSHTPGDSDPEGVHHGSFAGTGRFHIEDAVNWALHTCRSLIQNPRLTPTIFRVVGRISPLHFHFNLHGRHEYVSGRQCLVEIGRREATFDLYLGPDLEPDMPPLPIDSALMLIMSAPEESQYLSGLVRGNHLCLTHKLYETSVPEFSQAKWQLRPSPVCRGQDVVSPAEWMRGMPGARAEVLFDLDFVPAKERDDLAFKAHVLKVTLADEHPEMDMWKMYSDDQ
ncbi:hypothetical protein BOTBODRAFT_41338 [Botryobasidium botryosum FD-172 SS1]|uniref:Uncharacterized protein n=1 Tax=Botryobasidium botryosum (strain FD-172 SS1) TaxID=930990 RepID=A0A067N7J2_BOTB1|nr:hypothetical protein BOTBODRAFT_41338 [Botryobasidium botryosum FD-172 SS1]